MLVSVSWLKRYVDINVPAKILASDLTMLGLNVERSQTIGIEEKAIVIGRVLEVARHPDADRLSVCRVDVGAAQPLDVVCGAPNVAAGQLVPVALDGAQLPNGTKIRRSKIRGVVSNGMICSEIELGLGDDANGIMVLDGKHVPGTLASEVLGASDTIFEIEITPNRPDHLSHLGVAREIAALYETAVRYPFRPIEPGPARDGLAIDIESASDCQRYVGRVVRSLTVGPSPAWLRNELERVGVNSINNVVDISNYVMLETGQPLHAFDLSRLGGPKIVVRMADEGRSFATLDGMKRLLSSDDLMICDVNGPVALAGVMGGENSEVHEDTVDVLLESAYFAPAGVRRSSKRIGLSTESSRRFERGVDPNGVLRALHRLTGLIVESAGGTPTADWVDIYPKKIMPARLSLTASETNRVLGTDLGAPKIASILNRLGLAAASSGKGRVAATIPTFRPDLTRPIDLVEEVARLYGYSEIEATMPKAVLSPIERPRCATEEDEVRGALIGAGLTEIVLYGFASEDALAPFADQGPEPIRITNPISSEQGLMITSLLPNLVEAAKQNLMRQREDVRLFALQKVFQRTKALDSIDEPRMVAGLICGHRCPGAWERSREKVDFYDAKLCVETAISALGLSEDVIFQRGEPPAFLHPGRFAYVLQGGARVGFVGELHPDLARRLGIAQEVYVFELGFEKLAMHAQSRAPRYREFSRFPFVTRDIAIMLDESVPLCEVEKVISDSGVKILDDVRLFDVFRGGSLPAGKKSMAISLRFSRSDRTLTDEEASSAHAKIVDDLSAKLGAVLR